MRFRRRAAEDAADRRVIWQCASLLLGYPDERFAERLALVTAAAAALPGAAGTPLLGCVRELSGMEPVAAAVQAAGATPPAGELPDHLAVVLEFAATVDEAAGYRLLAAHRTSIDLLLDGLRRLSSPYAAVVGAVASTLPPPSEQDLRAARRLAMQGPPTEAVGLEPYPMPGASPNPSSGSSGGARPGPVDIAITPNPRIPAGKASS
jgi:nitrate reductase delta subunit